MSGRTWQDAAPDSIVGGRYRARRLIAEGGMSTVFEAEHTVTGAKVALKLLRPSVLGNPRAHARLMREARLLGAVRHPNVVMIHDAGECERYGPFLSLEMIDGRPLDGVLVARRTLPVAQSVALVVQLCEALDHAHSRGVIHRDVKPANVLVCSSAVGDRIELIDFGVAHESRSSADKLSLQGEILGTLEYMAPEQMMETGPVDARSDVYSVGATLYECLTGEVPFTGTVMTLISGFVQGHRPRSVREHRSDVPPALDDVVQKALALVPDQRFASAMALARAAVAAAGVSVPALDLLSVRDDRAPAQVAAAPADEGRARRQHVRAPYVTPVRIIIGADVFDGRTEDLSEGGVLVVAERALPIGDELQVRFSLPASGRLVTLPAIAKWVRTMRGQRAVGIEFRSTPDDVAAEIRAYATLMARDGAR
jgi:serine/threonine protein kinase